jgi:hypothetical protein
MIVSDLRFSVAALDRAEQVFAGLAAGCRCLAVCHCQRGPDLSALPIAGAGVWTVGFEDIEAKILAVH